jgi:proton-translocating NADH-quinone oxidoreductase chain L
MYLIVLVPPLISCLINLLTGTLIGYRGAVLLSVLFSVSLNMISYIIIYESLFADVPCILNLFAWLQIDTLNINFEFMFTALTAVMLGVVTLISAIVHIYAVEHMKNDPHRIRFLGHISLFTFFTIVLISGSNLFVIFVGWEGVGICSYLLINFWYSRSQANKAAWLAVNVNKISDVCVLCAIAMLCCGMRSSDLAVIHSVLSSAPYAYGTSSITDVLYHSSAGMYESVYTLPFGAGWSSRFNDVIILLSIIGAIGKSSQVGLHVWSPEAMEGPTPVSALIHAATMVTAGIYLPMRIAFPTEPSIAFSGFLSMIGSSTALFGAVAALFSKDCKKVVAYSTCSHSGYMFYACGQRQFNAALFHLASHANSKAILFPCAGSVIHLQDDEQDLRYYGGLCKVDPALYLYFMVGAMSLAGFPFLSGFFPKERIVEFAYSFTCFNGISVYNSVSIAEFVSSIASLGSVLYSIRLICYGFMGMYNGKLTTIVNIHYSSMITLTCLFVLCRISIVLGYVTANTLLLAVTIL